MPSSIITKKNLNWWIMYRILHITTGDYVCVDLAFVDPKETSISKGGEVKRGDHKYIFPGLCRPGVMDLVRRRQWRENDDLIKPVKFKNMLIAEEFIPIYINFCNLRKDPVQYNELMIVFVED